MSLSPAPADAPRILAVARLAPMLMDRIHARFQVHDRLHETDPAAFAAVAPHIVGIIASGESRVPATLIAQLPALKVISVMGVGYDGVDAPAAAARGVMVTHTPDVLNDDVADLAIGLLLAASRQIAAADRFVRAGQWPQGPMPLARKLTGATLGIVGMGRIGQAIAHRAAAFRMDIAYTARSPRTSLPYTYHPDAESLAAAVDHLVVITPGGAATRKLINARVLKALGHGLVVNVARGSVIDQDALIEALEQGVIAGAGLDVFEDEPNVPQRLRDLPQVVLTPHIGSATTQTRQAMADLAHDNLVAGVHGQAVLTPVPECRPLHHRG